MSVPAKTPRPIHHQKNAVIREVDLKAFRESGLSVPGVTLISGGVGLEPSGFTVEHPLLKGKVVPSDVSTAWIDASFSEEDADRVGVYCVSSSPHDGKSNYFCAWLAIQMWKKFKLTSSWTHVSKTLQVRPPLSDITFVYGCNATMNQYRVEALRDFLDFHASDTRVILVAGGCDPIALVSGVLNKPLHGFCFLNSQLSRRKIDVA